MHAMTHDLRRSPLPIKVAGIASIYLVMSVLVLLSIFGSENAIVKTRRVLNDPSGALLRAEIPRRYLYSQTDTMVPWKDVVSHAAEARKNLKADGNANIECIEFERSGHVAHMMVDKERYWRVIRETWERSANASKSWR